MKELIIFFHNFYINFRINEIPETGDWVSESKNTDKIWTLNKEREKENNCPLNINVSEYMNPQINPILKNIMTFSDSDLSDEIEPVANLPNSSLKADSPPKVSFQKAKVNNLKLIPLMFSFI